MELKVRSKTVKVVTRGSHVDTAQPAETNSGCHVILLWRSTGAMLLATVLLLRATAAGRVH